MKRNEMLSIGKYAVAMLLVSGAVFSGFAKKQTASAIPVMGGDDVVASEIFRDVDMVEISDGGDVNRFVIGQDSQSWTSEREVRPYFINRYETDYRLWFYVCMWAQDNGYAFINPGQEGSKGKRGKFPSEVNMYQPVTMISWYDAVVWCNAFSEMTGRTPCYVYEGFVIRDAWDALALDQLVCRFGVDGYRLPTEAEWELAARKTETGMQKGNLASGERPGNSLGNGKVSCSDVGWTFENSRETHVVGTAGTPFQTNAAPSPGSGKANGAGIFDMTGNVLEFCWDWYGNYEDQKEGTVASGKDGGSLRVLRGGSWSPYTLFNNAGDRYAFDPNEAYNYLGFRIAQSIVKPIDMDVVEDLEVQDVSEVKSETESEPQATED